MESCHTLETTHPKHLALKIGVMGGASGTFDKLHMDKAHQLGHAIADHDCVTITGACPGLPLAAACGAKQKGGLVVGISPGLSLDEHIYKYGSPTEFHDVLIFTGSGLMGREIVNIRSSDIVIIIGGRSGTLGELAIAYDEGKLIGVLTGTGGISDMIAEILKACSKDTGAFVQYDDDAAKLVNSLLETYRTSHHKRPSCFCAERPRSELSSDATLARDPVCGMKIAPASAAATRVYLNQYFYFCSEHCASRFDADAKQFLDGRGQHA
jgi:uncharacterized protein (TIGR00725 family)